MDNEGEVRTDIKPTGQPLMIEISAASFRALLERINLLHGIVREATPMLNEYAEDQYNGMMKQVVTDVRTRWQKDFEKADLLLRKIEKAGIPDE